MKQLSAILGFFLFFLPLLCGQVVKTNEKGEKIIEYPDGTWKPFVESGTEDPLGVSPDPVRTWEEPDPEEEARKKAIRIAELLSADAERLGNYKEEARTRRLVLEDELEDMRSRTDLFSPQEVLQKEKLLNEQREREMLSNKLYDHSCRLAQDAENLIFLKPKKRDKALKKLETEKKQLEDQMVLLANIGKQDAPPQPVVQAPKTYLSYDPSKDTRLNPPAGSCAFTHNEVDKFTGKMRRDLEPVLLFTHTPKDLRPFLRDREYITCKAHLADLSDGLLFLSLEFSIASNNAPAAFGGIPSGGILSILSLKGESLRLVNSRTDAGVYDSGKGVYVYRAQYQISGLQEKALQLMEIDKLRVIWATGYEDYEVFELDFFRNQINCLRNVN